jgi:hypothetical protein
LLFLGDRRFKLQLSNGAIRAAFRPSAFFCPPSSNPEWAHMFVNMWRIIHPAVSDDEQSKFTECNTWNQNRIHSRSICHLQWILTDCSYNALQMSWEFWRAPPINKRGFQWTSDKEKWFQPRLLISIEIQSMTKRENECSTVNLLGPKSFCFPFFLLIEISQIHGTTTNECLP